MESPGGRQHLLFELHGALYAIEALAVREVHQVPELAPVAEGPPFLAGVLNLRGRIVPVVDLARRLGHSPQPCRLEDSLIVLQSGEDVLAIMANAVRGVQAIAPDHIQLLPIQGPIQSPTQGPAANFHDSREPLVRGVARVHEEVASLLWPEALLRLGSVTSAAGAPLSELSGEPSGASAGAPSSTWGALSARGFSTEHLAPHERAVLRERARRLMEPAGEQESEAAFPVALVAVGGEIYGLALESVREFCPMRQASPVPCCPPHILGQMNLRGDIVTLLDIQPLLQMPARHPSHASPRPGCVVVATHQGAPIGIVVDEVLDVLYLAQRQVKAPGPGTGGSKYLDGAILHGGKVICLLDLPRALEEGGLAVDETV